MKKLILSLSIFTSTICLGQSNAFGPTLSYQNQSGNFIKIGGYYMRIASNSFGIKVDATANLAHMRNNFVAIPEAGISIFPNADLLASPYFEGEITPYTVTPKLGLSLAHVLDLNIGYGFEMDIKNDFKPVKGFTFSLGISIPLNQILD